jgi:hypothetical protein
LVKRLDYLSFDFILSYPLPGPDSNTHATHEFQP